MQKINDHVRLIGGNDVAAYLDMARSTFDQRRPRLEAAGFPKPVLQRDQFGSMKWDRHAIDAWLDQRSGLDQKDKLKVVITPAIDWESKLVNRAQSMDLTP